MGQADEQLASRPRIGVTGDGRRWAPSWWCLALAVRLGGGDPVRISVRHEAGTQPLHGLIISGGNDIGPDLYGGEEAPKARIDSARDALEVHWIQTALDEGWPMLGICRGAQLINAVLGGSLHQDIRPLRRYTYNRPGLLPTKQVFLEPDSRVNAIFRRRRLRVNSLHHQAIDVPGNGLSVVGRDLDNICQAIEHIDRQPVIGVQWHPEYLFYLPAQLRLFRWLINEAAT